MEISKLGVILPSAKSIPRGENPLLPIPKGMSKGQDLALVEGVTPQIIGRNASKLLWTNDELKSHMLSPKGKNKVGNIPRTDFSPVRKATLRGYFSLYSCSFSKRDNLGFLCNFSFRMELEFN